MFCSNCGQQIEEGSLFCQNCGTPVESAPAFVPPTAPVPPANPGFHAPGGWDAEQPAQTPPQRSFEQPQPFQPASAPQQPFQSYQQPTAPQQPYQPYQQPTAPQQPYQQPVAPQAYQQPGVPQQPYVVNNNYYQMVQQPARRLSTNRGLAKFILLNFVTFGIYGIVFFTNISTSLNTAASRYDGRKTMNYCLVFFIFSWLTCGIVPLVWFSKMSGRTGNELLRRGINYSFGAGTFWLWCILGSLIVCGPFIYLHKLAKAMNLICEDYNFKG